MLKAKRERNYRRGVKGVNCGTCASFVPDFQVNSCNGVPLKVDQRCKVIGLQNGRMYRVVSAGLCDSYEEKK